jgi:hypothetical protein
MRTTIADSLGTFRDWLCQCLARLGSQNLHHYDLAQTDDDESSYRVGDAEPAMNQTTEASSTAKEPPSSTQGTSSVFNLTEICADLNMILEEPDRYHKTQKMIMRRRFQGAVKPPPSDMSMQVPHHRRRRNNNKPPHDHHMVQPQTQGTSFKWSDAAIKRSKCLQFTRFIQRVDLMVLHALETIIYENASQFEQSLRRGRASCVLNENSVLATQHIAVDDTNGRDCCSSRDITAHQHVKCLPPMLSPLFVVELHLHDTITGTLEFVPSLESILDAIDATLRGFFHAFSDAGMTRLMDHPLLLPFIRFSQEYRVAAMEEMKLTTTTTTTTMATKTISLLEKETSWNALASTTTKKKTAFLTLEDANDDDDKRCCVSNLLLERAIQDTAFVNQRARIVQRIKDSMDDCRTYMHAFDGLVRAHNSNMEINFDVLAQRHLEGTYSLDMMRADIMDFQHQVCLVFLRADHCRAVDNFTATCTLHIYIYTYI